MVRHLLVEEEEEKEDFTTWKCQGSVELDTCSLEAAHADDRAAEKKEEE